MKIKIPSLKHGPEYDALADCIEYAAERTKLSDARVLTALTFFWERVAANMCAGNVVPIPGFGKFGGWLETRRVRLARDNRGFPYCIPRFVAARPLRLQMKTTAPSSSAAKESLRNFQRNSTRTKPSRVRVHSEMERIRKSIADQLGDVE